MNLGLVLGYSEEEGEGIVLQPWPLERKSQKYFSPFLKNEKTQDHIQ